MEKLPNVKEIDGKYYYYDNNGKVRTNFTLIADGKILHFDETGAYTDTSIDTVNKDIVTTRSNLYKNIIKFMIALHRALSMLIII